MARSRSGRSGPEITRAIVEGVDALVLQGGADMSPVHYGEEPLRPEWAGDHARDLYELELVRLCLAAGKPILGCCRGAQVLNVALGGSLWQDIETMHPERRVHRNWEVYDKHLHDVEIAPGSWLARCYGLGADGGHACINSVHHQGVKTLGRDLVVEAKAPHDGVIEAIRYEGADAAGRPAFALGVQWHPEFMYGAPVDPRALDPGVLLRGFLGEVEGRRSNPNPRAQR